MNQSTLLRTQGLTKKWGGFVANSDISLRFEPGSRHALIGPNGAGKTTFINLLTGGFMPSGGGVFLGEEDITGLPMHQRVGRGITRTFQINTLFAEMTVLASVIMAINEREGNGFLWHRSVASNVQVQEEAFELLESLNLAAEANTITKNLAYGKQRLLEIALALATKPKVLLLDEPAAGIPSAESRELFEVIARLPRSVTIVFIEHDMGLVFKFAERITVLVGGQVLVEGAPEEIAANDKVKEVYLGESDHE